jgi:hypothetical protein
MDPSVVEGEQPSAAMGGPHGDEPGGLSPCPRVARPCAALAEAAGAVSAGRSFRDAGRQPRREIDGMIDARLGAQQSSQLRIALAEVIEAMRL